MLDRPTQRLLRDLSPRALGALVRRFGDFAGCEDAMQEALIAAANRWPEQGVPGNPVGWLLLVATRRLTDQHRAAAAARQRERLAVSLMPADEQIALAADEASDERDDTLDLFFLCCHPALTVPSQIALTLRAVGGLTTPEIARAFHVPEATMAQRLGRARQSIRDAGAALGELDDEARRGRLPSVLHVLYLIFNEGYLASGGEQAARVDLSEEAIRAARLLLRELPGEPEVEGLLSLMLLTDARRQARVGPLGELIPLDSQDRARWDRAAIDEGAALVSTALGRGAPGPFQVQAAIAALHDEAPSTEATDWAQILSLYGALLGMIDSPMAQLSRAIALAMVEGPAAGLRALDALASDPRLAGGHRLDAARAHLLERAGEAAQAAALYRRAAGLTPSAPERDYLLLKAARLAGG